VALSASCRAVDRRCVGSGIQQEKCEHELILKHGIDVTRSPRQRALASAEQYRELDVTSLHKQFQDGHEPADIEATFRWLDEIDRNPLAQAFKVRMLELCPVSAGNQVLDVGCGLGYEAMRLVRRVGSQGRVVGIDANPLMIAEARRRVGSEAPSIAFKVGDAQHLAFPDNSFDLCRTERVLRYLESPEEALAQMIRVARPGGCVLAFDFDSDQTLVDAPDSTLVRKVGELLDAAVPSPWIGRQLFRLFRQVGLINVQVVPHAICLSGASGFGVYRQLNQGTIARAMQAGRMAPTEVAAWWTALEHAAEAETFFSANLGFIVKGVKP
jgi:ubiquinone/menaquinone biosynthesis C-methylase UbiE